MRSNEPFHGIILVGGHVVFHVALLIGSIFVVKFPEDTEKNHMLLCLINYFRMAHGAKIIYKIIDYALSSPEKFAKYMFTQKLLETISMFSYFVVAMYALWGVAQVDEIDFGEDKIM